MRIARGIAAAAAVAIAASTLVTGGPAMAEAACAEPGHPSGEWRSFGHDLANTRSQPLETAIDPMGSLRLEANWTASIAEAEGAGNYQSTPAVADGCLYVGTSSSWILALNADTGETVWATNVGDAGLAGGIFAVSVVDGLVHANVSTSDGPKALALSQADGSLAWATDVLYDGPGAYSNASSVVYDGIVFSGFSGGEGNAEARGGWALIEASTGEVLKTVYAISDEDFDRGYAGAGIWATAVVDEETGFAYVGAGNPFNAGRDHKHSNAILKIDLNRGSDTFGEIVDAYKGDADQYYPALEVLASSPACTSDIPATIDNPQCGQIDLDFGASPNLFTDEFGTKLVGALQKSGVYHVAYADTMQKAWTAFVGTPCALCNASSTAFDGERIYVAATTPGQMVALDATSGAYEWVTPIADGAHYQSVSVANGVVYTTDTYGRLDAYDAETGLQMNARPMALDTRDACTALSSGVAIARGRVYATCDIGVTGGGWVVAYGFDEGF